MQNFEPLDWMANSQYKDAEAILGPISLMINSKDMRPVWMQLDDNAPNGWQPADDQQGWQLTADDALIYPGLPPLSPAAVAVHNHERIFVYPEGFVCIAQLGGDFSVARIVFR